VLGVREQGGRALRDELIAALAGRRLLLVLDNFEQVLPAARVVLDVLGICPQLTALVTSREALRVRGEHEFSVLPLALPDLDTVSGDTLSGDAIERFGAVALFLERARAVRPDFAVETAEQAHLVATICARLDGLPLAIELAAARIRHFSLGELHQRLTGQAPLGVLAGGARDLADHQRAMRATIDWSYRLLRPEEQWLFRMLILLANLLPFLGLDAWGMLTDKRSRHRREGEADHVSQARADPPSPSHHCADRQSGVSEGQHLYSDAR
jgi:predicted ATPase